MSLKNLGCIEPGSTIADVTSLKKPHRHPFFCVDVEHKKAIEETYDVRAQALRVIIYNNIYIIYTAYYLYVHV